MGNRSMPIKRGEGKRVLLAASPGLRRGFMFSTSGGSFAFCFSSLRFNVVRQGVTCQLLPSRT